MVVYKSHLLTRRQSIAALSLGAMGLMLPGRGRAAQDVEALLRARLETLQLPVVPARTELVQFSYTQQDTTHHICALIRLTWAPGVRQRRLTAQGRDAEAVVTAIAEKFYQNACARLPVGPQRV